MIIVIIICFAGPSTWAKNYPTAAGVRQSPVDIETTVATSDTSLVSKPLRFKYVAKNTRSIVNTGYGWRVDVDSQGSGKDFEMQFTVPLFFLGGGGVSGKANVREMDHT
jgi:carbonic anhydrase